MQPALSKMRVAVKVSLIFDVITVVGFRPNSNSVAINPDRVIAVGSEEIAVSRLGVYGFAAVSVDGSLYRTSLDVVAVDGSSLDVIAVDIELPVAEVNTLRLPVNTSSCVSELSRSFVLWLPLVRARARTGSV